MKIFTRWSDWYFNKCLPPNHGRLLRQRRRKKKWRGAGYHPFVSLEATNHTDQDTASLMGGVGDDEGRRVAVQTFMPNPPKMVCFNFFVPHYTYWITGSRFNARRGFPPCVILFFDAMVVSPCPPHRSLLFGVIWREIPSSLRKRENALLTP